MKNLLAPLKAALEKLAGKMALEPLSVPLSVSVGDTASHPANNK